MKSYRLLKDIVTPAGTVKAGTIGRWPDNIVNLWEFNYCDNPNQNYPVIAPYIDNPEWFEEVIEHTDLHLVAGKPYEYYLGEFHKKMKLLNVVIPNEITFINESTFDKLWRFAHSKQISLEKIPDMLIYTEDDLRNAFEAARHKDPATRHSTYSYENIKDYLNQIKKQ